MKLVEDNWNTDTQLHIFCNNSRKSDMEKQTKPQENKNYKEL